MKLRLSGVRYTFHYGDTYGEFKIFLETFFIEELTKIKGFFMVCRIFGRLCHEIFMFSEKLNM